MNQELSNFHDFIKPLFSTSSMVNYLDVENWPSMQSLIVISAIDEKYDLLISHEDLSTLKNLEALYLFIKKNTNV